MDKRDKRHQREKSREVQNRQSKEYRLFDKETKDYSYSIIFTNDLKEIFDAKNDCKALFEKDQDNDYFYVFDKNGNYIKCISQENKFNGTWSEFQKYSMIQWNNSECVVIYLKDYTDSIVGSVLEAYLNENESLCLEIDLMENDMESKKVTITEKNERGEIFESEILTKAIILEKIENLDKYEIFEYMCLQIDKGTQTITCFMDLRDGSIFYSYIRENEYFQVQEKMNYLKLESLNFHFQTPFENESHRFKNPTNFYNKSSWIDWDAYMKYAFDLNEIKNSLYFVYDFDRENNN